MAVLENLLVPMDYCLHADEKAERERAQEVLQSVGLTHRRHALAETKHAQVEPDDRAEEQRHRQHVQDIGQRIDPERVANCVPQS